MMFGSTLSTAAPTGTTIKFDPVKGSDTMMRNGLTQSIQTKLMCITAMKQYETKCLEELRVEDYQANRKQPTAGSTTSGFGGTLGTSNTSSLFGSKPTTGFGATTTPAFGQASTGNSLFGSTQNKPAGGLFGSTNTSSPFASTSNANASGSLFGAKPAFGQQSSTSLFGATNTATTTQSGFGFGAAKPTTSTGFGSTFGQTNTGTSSLFGSTQSKPLFGSTTTSQPSTGMFGATTSQPAQGTTLFGGGATGTQGTTSIFGGGTSQPAAGTSLFGGNTQQNTGQTGIFGSQPQQSTGTSLFGTATNTGTSLFGNTASQQAGFGGTSAFGQKPAGTGLFGATTGQPQQQGAFTLGGATQVAQPQQSVLQVPQQPLLITRDTEQMLQQSILESQMSMYPYGTDELFRTISVRSTAEQANEAMKSKLEKERLLNTYAASKFADLSSDKNKQDDGLRKFTQCVLTANKPKVFSYKPLIQRSGLDESRNESQELNDSNGFLNRSTSSYGNKTQSFSELKTGLFIPTVMNTSKSRDNPKRFDASVLKDKSSSRLDESILSRKSMLNHSIAHDTLTIDNGTRDRRDSIAKDESLLNGSKNNSVFTSTPAEKQHSPKSVHFSQDELNLSTVSNGHDVSVRTTLSENDENQLNRTIRHGPCNVLISSRNIYTEPSLEELETFVRNGKIFIKEKEAFKVGRIGYGSVLWEGPFDFSDVDLAEIVQFHRKEVVVYPDEKKKPHVGCELNRPAIICLENVFPIDRISREYIKDPDHPEVKRFSALLEKKCLKMGCSFIEYDAEGGLWTFKVKHFSKYGFYDDDEEEGTQVLPQQKKVLAPKQTVEVQTELEMVVEMDDVDVPLASEPTNAGTLLRERFLNFDESMRAPMVDPKRLFLSESPEVVQKKKMRFTDDLMEFELRGLDILGEGEKKKKEHPVVRQKVNKIMNFNLTHPIFKELNVQGLFGPLIPLTFRRVGFAHSAQDAVNVTVLKDPRPRSAAVQIQTVKLVPTIETYMRQHLEKIGRTELFDELVNTEMLHMNPPSDLIRLVDDYLFNELRLNYSLEEIAVKMLKFCEAMCQDPSDIRFGHLQRTGFIEWVVKELSTKLEKKLKQLSENNNNSLYVPVYYALLFADFDQAIQLARHSGLNDLSMLIGLYSAGTRIPDRLLKYQKAAFEHCREGSDPYRTRVYALLSHSMTFSRAGKLADLRKDLPVLQLLAIQLTYFSTFKDSMSSSVQALPAIVRP
ncbi:unnamed protein product [Bursaphelenchus xylophilus]|uniref:Nuclear pore complex protein Nup98-Nup96 n=1 Tax=Bursaphelenchus xylophilus TaxID=6326 RepID=A0A1I7S432_BURXY|nr:unnamed protein product [Bursaphelenchus xylophilus]CAG9116670.1 unnamed protein product [Bursaphelenchus xylophilus]